MQVLFSMDMNGTFSEEAVADYCSSFPPAKRVLPFFNYLINGVLQHKEHIDSVVERFSSNWKIRRMACVDRNVLRLAIFELLYCADVPSKVAINEAIDIGKKFGTPESGSFINGIIDSIRIAIDKHQLTPIALPLPPEIEPETETTGNERKEQPK